MRLLETEQWPTTACEHNSDNEAPELASAPIQAAPFHNKGHDSAPDTMRLSGGSSSTRLVTAARLDAAVTLTWRTRPKISGTKTPRGPLLRLIVQ